MLAAVPVAKAADGSWRGVNLTFYGFFSATGTAFGFAIMLLLLASVGIPASIAILLALLVLLVCVPASRVIAGLVERKRNTFTVAGAAFVASLVFPLLVLALQPLAAKVLHHEIAVLPILAAAAISYVLGESIGRLACLSFGCCYGMPLRDAKPAIARLFQKHNLVIHGSTKKAAYASGLAGEPLIPVQAHHVGGIRRRRTGGARVVSGATVSPGGAGSGDCELGMARLLGVVACRSSRRLSNFRLPGDGR